MKRVPEFTIGLIGSILSLLIAAYFFYAFGCMPAINKVADAGFISNGIGTVLSIAAIVFASLINKITKISSIILIVVAVGLFLTNFFQIVSTILLLIAGIMGLARKVEL
ncbi:MAG: hypothetical protein RR500_09040 [Bacilli bacterium]